MLETPCSEVVWRVLATHTIRQFPLHFPYRASPCAITFQLDSTNPYASIHSPSPPQQRGHSMEWHTLIQFLYFISTLLMNQNSEFRDKLKQKKKCYCNIFIFCKRIRTVFKIKFCSKHTVIKSEKAIQIQAAKYCTLLNTRYFMYNGPCIA